MAVNPIPPDYPRIIPSLAISGAAKAIDWYGTVLGTTERMRMEGPGGTIAHCELTLGDGMIMLADEFPDMGFLSPETAGGPGNSSMVYVEDVDAVFGRAIANGATSIKEPADEFYGDRSAQFRDPFGHRWSIAAHVEDVSEEEMQRRMAEMMGESE